MDNKNIIMQKVKIIDGIIYDLVTIEEVIENLKKEKDLKIIKFSVSDEILSAIKSKPEYMRTFSEQIKLETRGRIEKEYFEKLSTYDDYKELIIIPCDKSYNDEIETLIPEFKVIGDKVEQTFYPKLDKIKIQRLIAENKKILSDTDYIIIKCYESKLSLSDNSYSKEYIDQILNKRQSARDKINQLESLMS